MQILLIITQTFQNIHWCRFFMMSINLQWQKNLCILSVWNREHQSVLRLKGTLEFGQTLQFVAASYEKINIYFMSDSTKKTQDTFTLECYMNNHEWFLSQQFHFMCTLCRKIYYLNILGSHISASLERMIHCTHCILHEHQNTLYSKNTSVPTLLFIKCTLLNLCLSHEGLL